MEFTGKSVRMTLDDGIARVVLTQSERGNPIDADFGGEFLTLSSLLATGAGVRAVLLTAEGRFFSVGGDIKLFKDRLDELPGLILDWTATLHVALARLRRIDAPLVCAVQGPVAGGAVSVMAFADVVHAAEGVRFTAAFPALGFCADSGTTVSLSQRMGIARARRFILCNETLTDREALAAGLIDHLHPAAELAAAAEKTARAFAAGPTFAYGEIKRSFQNALGNRLEDQLEIEAFALSSVAAGADAREGVSAFAGKRPPVFKGR